MCIRFYSLIGKWEDLFDCWGWNIGGVMNEIIKGILIINNNCMGSLGCEIHIFGVVEWDKPFGLNSIHCFKLKN